MQNNQQLHRLKQGTTLDIRTDKVHSLAGFAKYSLFGQFLLEKIKLIRKFVLNRNTN